MPDARAFPATAMPDRDWWRALWPDPDAVIAALGIERGMRVADIGCGDGWFTAAIARLVAPAEVVALDLYAEMLALARETCGSLANCRFVLGDARDASRLLADAHTRARSLDYVLVANTFHGAPEKTALARSLGAALRPGGRLGIVSWHARPREETTVLGAPRGPRTELRMTPEATRAAVEPAGFALESVVDLPPYHYGAIFGRADRT